MQHKQPGQSLWYDLQQDLRLILAYEGRSYTWREQLWGLLACDAYMVLLLFRVRSWARRYRIPFINRIIRFLQTALYAIELGNDIQLGHGVYFVHTVGTVVGGDARIGEGCVFFGNNTIGAARFSGSPQIGAYTVIGAGVRILGPIQVGSECFLGANAVVIDNIPERQIAVGIPARIVRENEELENMQRMKSVSTQRVS
ncbi:MAG: serine O-acetyltransferase EpsC [Oligoflexus sp.]|jgi:serine O-acetyltransferase